MRALGLDIGTKRTGVSLAVDGIVTEYETIREPELMVVAVKIAAEKEQAELIVIGLPLNEDGTESSQATYVRTIAEQIEQVVQLPTVFVDEYLTSSEAERQMLDHGINKAEIDHRIDQYSAKLILEQYLSEQS
jgi:putative Holliday junction resolvase